MASSIGSSSSRQQWTPDGLRRQSPIPYRRGPLDYENTVLCHCGNKAALWISWSDNNPGRRYLKCYNARNGGCNFMGWYKPPVDGFVHSVLVDLRDTVWSLKREKMELKAALADAVLKLQEQKKELRSMSESQMPGKKSFWMLGLFVSSVVVVGVFLKMA